MCSSAFAFAAAYCVPHQVLCIPQQQKQQQQQQLQTVGTTTAAAAAATKYNVQRHRDRPCGTCEKVELSGSVAVSSVLQPSLAAPQAISVTCNNNLTGVGCNVVMILDHEAAVPNGKGVD